MYTYRWSMNEDTYKTIIGFAICYAQMDDACACKKTAQSAAFGYCGGRVSLLN